MTSSTTDLATIVRDAVGEEYSKGTLDALATQAVKSLADVKEMTSEDLNSALAATLAGLRNKLRVALYPYTRGITTVDPSALSAVLSRLSLKEPDAQARNIDGLKATPWYIERVELCEAVINATFTQSRVLIRAPYASGKTSLAQLIDRRLRNSNTKSYLISFANCNGSNWEALWEREFPTVRLTTVTNTEELVFIIIDEVQVSYDKARPIHSLWEFIKDLANAKPNIRFICFGAYGSIEGLLITPIDFHIVFCFTAHDGLLGLAYTEKEFQSLREAFRNTPDGFAIDDKSANYIFYIANGYSGIIGKILMQAAIYFKNKSKEFATAHLYEYLHKKDLVDSLVHISCRAIPDFDKMSTVGDVCKKILCGDAYKVPKNEFKNELETQLNDCLKVSMVLDDNKMISFAAPIIQNKALAYYYGAPVVAKPQSLSQFVTSVVQRFLPSQLLNSVSRDKHSRLMEAQWQKEFYRAAASFLPRDVFVSPEYGREQGIDGQVDFYISEYRWMIEVLREGIDMAGHERRFEEGGQYKALLNQVEEWAVLDFRATTDLRRKPHPNTYHYRFSLDFSFVVISDPKGGETTLPLLGDKVSDLRQDSKQGGTPAKIKPH